MASEMPETVRLIDEDGILKFPAEQVGTEYVLATTHQRTLEALREAREALLVFAAFSDKAERFVEHKAKFGGTAIFPVKDFRLSHFRRAVEVVALIDTLWPGDAP